MNEILTNLEKLKGTLKSAAFLVSKENSAQDAHEKIVESLLIVSQLSHEINFLFTSNTPANKKFSPYSDARDEKKEEIKKVRNRIPRWFRNRSQYNSTILLTYLELSEEHGEEINVEYLKSMCPSIKDFYGNYNQMKNFGEKNHGKVFEERNGYITLWNPIKEDILKLYKEIH